LTELCKSLAGESLVLQSVPYINDFRSSLDYLILPHEAANYFKVPSLIASTFWSLARMKWPVATV